MATKAEQQASLKQATKKKLSFSFSKAVTIFLEEKRNEELQQITLRNQIIHYRECTQFLWMTLESQLNRGEHIIEITAKQRES